MQYLYLCAGGLLCVGGVFAIVAERPSLRDLLPNLKVITYEDVFGHVHLVQELGVFP